MTMQAIVADAAEQAELSARTAIRTARQQIRSKAIEADPDRAVELAVALAAASDGLSDALRGEAGCHPATAWRLSDLLMEVTELQQDLRDHTTCVRFRALERIGNSLDGLRAAASIAELLENAPAELCHACDFDRALLSRVCGSSWVPEHWCIASGGDARVTQATEEFLRDAAIPLSPMLLETELARRGRPALVTDPHADQRTYKKLIEASATRGYVAAPIMPTGRVIGFLHADCVNSGRRLDVHDRDNIHRFATGFGLIFERLVLLERLDEQRETVRAAFSLAADQIDHVVESEIRLRREQREAAANVDSAGPIVLGHESRINALLTAREREVLQIMVSGARNTQIADQLVISEGTVKSHVKNICRKLRAGNRAEAVSKYLQLVMREQR